MKKRLSIFCTALAMFAANSAEAQLGHRLGDHIGNRGGIQGSQPVFQNFSSEIGLGAVRRRNGQAGRSGKPGRLLFRSSTADKGLGFDGSYLTLQAKNRLFEDQLDGRWLIEGNVHHSIEDDGGFFANVGLERVFSIDAAGADVSLSAWYDYDGDKRTGFTHDFHQVGASAQIKTRKWDVIGNGYFPVGIQEYAFGSATNSFVGNSIVVIPGVDAALEGFDVTLRSRPERLAFVNGTIDLGGYHYSAEAVNAFAGGRVRLGFQLPRGFIVNAEVNHDERFDTTGVVSVGWLFGANASGHGHEYSGIGRDLEMTVRNDHIVRFNQDFEVALDPETGAAYNVVHVDNEADPLFADGSAETPYADLLAAQNGSVEGDVILVNSGDGTDRSMDRGITLKNRQRLWSNGQELLIPIQNGENFRLSTDPSGITPTISNDGGFATVVMADDNDVAGLNIDGEGAQFGIWGNGNKGSLRNNTISNANSDGARLASISGDWTVSGNTFADNGRDGLFMIDALDTTSTISFESNTATGNAFEGIHLRNYDPAAIEFLRNVTSNNVRHGMFLENYLNTAGADPIVVQNHIADENAGVGLFLNGGSGDMAILNSTITNNDGSGVVVRNWANSSTETILIGTNNNGTSNLTGNGDFANLQFLIDEPGVNSRVIVTNQTLSDGIRGIAAKVEGITGAGVRSTLDIDIIDNVEISRNVNDGIRLSATNSGLINANITNTDPTQPLLIVDNTRGTGAGIQITADGLNGQAPGEVNATIENVTIINEQSRVVRPGLPTIIVPTAGVGINSINNGLVDVSVSDSTIGIASQPALQDTENGVLINLNNNGSQLINKISLDNLTMFSNFGVVLLTGTETYSDLSLTNSRLLPNGIQTIGGRSDNTPFGDGIGQNGVFVQAIGQAILSGSLNTSQSPNSFYTNPGFGFAEAITDGVLDNLTRVTIEDNVIQDFTLEGIDISTFGDAQMLLNITGNQVTNNGAGFNDDQDNDNVFGEQAGDGAGIADPNNLFFYDGVNIDAFDQSTISTRIAANVFTDNFERGLSLNTFSSATINAVVTGNSFFGNDRGEDADSTLPPVGVGTSAGATPAIAESGQFDFEAVNNEEYYLRAYESLVLIAGDDGVPTDLAGVDLTNNAIGFFFPGNVGLDVFGNPVALGVARLNLSMSGNALQLGPDLLDFSQAPGDFTLGLDGLTNGFTGGFFGITDVAFPATDALVDGEEGFFGAENFTFPIH